MEEKTTYSECEMKYVRYAGLSPEQATEVCAAAERRDMDEEREKAREEEFWDE